MFKRFMFVFAVLAFLTSCGSTPQAKIPEAAPASLVGHWTQVRGMPGDTMVADITNDKITIQMTLGNSTGLYWVGTFDPTKAAAGSIVSVGDTDAMSTQLFASNEKTKTFFYKDGGLSYGFSMMGVSSTVYLSPGA
jgi:hypothetical protein